MACSLAIRNDRHADRPQRERTEMIGQSIDIRSRLSIALVGVALALSTSQGIMAETLRPSVDDGGSGSAEETLPDFALTANGRSIALIESEEAPVVVAEEQAQPDFALTQNGRSIALIESKEASGQVASTFTGGGYYAIVDEQGSAVVPELVAAGSNERMASASSASPRMICVACATFQ